MNKLIKAERFLLTSHIVSMAFGLAGLLLVLPNPDFIVKLPEFGQAAFRWSMAGGGVVYMLLGMSAVAVYAYRTLGLWHWLSFMLPAISISLASELLGTSTGFPFGHYRYLSGLGYKIAGLVPFTIPLSWFYLGFSTYILAKAGLAKQNIPSWLKNTAPIVLGSILLTSWDFVLDPAMSQTSLPFWVWDIPGAFFGMPYQNFAGWLGTGAVFMTVASWLEKVKPLTLPKGEYKLPLAMYLGNFAFAMIISLAEGIYLPIILGILTGVIPALWLYRLALSSSSGEDLKSEVELVAVKVPIST